jgi:NarL family two-component system response regulator LiaR
MGQTDTLDTKKNGPQKIRVLTVDDHELVRDGMAFLLSPFNDIEVVGAAHSGEEAIRLCAELRPDVVLMDMLLPGMDGAAATRAIRARYPQVQVLALTSFHEEELVARTMHAGAIGYLLKGVSIDELAGGIRSAHAGKPVLAAEAVLALAQAARNGQKPGGDLSRRELEVLELLVAGKSNPEIAEALTISLPTVKSHVSSILSKLGAANRAEAASVAVKHNLVPH